MKRKIDVLICLALMLCLQATKAAVSGGPGDPIPLELIGNDDEIFGPGYPKSPEDTPTVSLDDHTLYFTEAFCEVVMMSGAMECLPRQPAVRELLLFLSALAFSLAAVWLLQRNRTLKALLLGIIS